MKKTVKKKEGRSASLTILEMIFSLLMIPCGLAFARNIDVANSSEKIMALLPVGFLLMTLATFFRAAAKRYKYQIRPRQLTDYISSAAFLVCSAVLFVKTKSLLASVAAGVVFIVSLLPGRVLSIIRNRRWYRVLLNAVIILMIVYYAILIWEAPPEIMVYVSVITMFMIAFRGFIRVMSVTFTRLRLDLLRDIVRTTYAAEIMFGLVLLILSFSWVLMYTDPNFSSFTDALWYCFAVVTTIGFGDFAAVSFTGRILSVILGMYGIVVVALITSIIVNFYGEMKKAGPGDEETIPEEEPGTDGTESPAAEAGGDTA